MTSESSGTSESSRSSAASPAHAARQEDAGPGPTGERTRSLAAPCVALAVLGFLAALGFLGVLPGAALPFAAAPALLLGFALPILALASPRPGDPFKLAVFTLALSAPLATACFALARLGLPSDGALATTAALGALLALGARRRSVRVVPRSRAELVVLALGLACASLAAFALLRGSEPRFAFPGIERAGLFQALERSIPPRHPWLAGEPWPRAFAGDLLAELVARSLRLAPTLAHAWLAVLGAGLAAPVLFLLGGSLGRGARRNLLGVLAALGATCLSIDGDGATPLALFFAPGPAPLVLALSLLGLYGATHLVRHGERPWPLLVALAHGAALLFDFGAAWPAALATALVALTPWTAAAARPRVLLALALAAVPGALQARTLLPSLAAEVTARPSSLGLVPWALLALLGLVACLRELDRERRAAPVLLFATASAAFVAASRGAWTPGIVALVAFPLGLLAAGVLPEQVRAARARATLGGLALAALAIWGVASTRAIGLAALESSRRDAPLAREIPSGLEPAADDAMGRDLRAAFDFLRAQSRLATERLVLLACPVQNPYRTTRDLPPLALAAATPLALYGEARATVTESEVQYLPRLEELLRLFRKEQDFDPTLFPRLERLGAGGAVLLLREEDIAFAPAVLGKLERLGFARWKDWPTVSLWIGPRAAAARFGLASER